MVYQRSMPIYGYKYDASLFILKLWPEYKLFSSMQKNKMNCCKHNMATWRATMFVWWELWQLMNSIIIIITVHIYAFVFGSIILLLSHESGVKLNLSINVSVNS